MGHLNLLLSLTVGIALTAMPDLSRASEVSSSESLAARAFRTDEGVQADDAWIAAVAATDHDSSYGVPLTAAEAAELDRRAGIAQAYTDERDRDYTVYSTIGQIILGGWRPCNVASEPYC